MRAIWSRLKQLECVFGIKRKLLDRDWESDSTDISGSEISASDSMPGLTSSSGSDDESQDIDHGTSNEVSTSSLGRRFDGLDVAEGSASQVLEAVGDARHGVIEPLPGQVALDIMVEETSSDLENFEAWLAGNRWIVDNDNTTTDDENTQAENVSQNKRAEE